ncbi:D-Ala-D-Ala carboxypeptidase family metallohydrolase [Neorhizobium galegae]|nr:D-Ala-D-Ala carboxypeptidase family metallohydrolase [Neorhizobium galegae]
MLLDWDLKNPDSNLMEKEKAAREIGELIRSRIQPDPKGDLSGVYISEADKAKQEALPEEVPAAVEAPKAEEEGGYLQTIQDAWNWLTGDDEEKPAAAAQNVTPGATTQAPALDTLKPSSRTAVEAFAKKKGITPEEANTILYNRMKALSPEVDPTTTNSISTETKDRLTSLLKDPPKVERLTASNVPVEPILGLIGGAEGSDSTDGYNATLANGELTGGKQNLVGMTLGQIDELQTKMLEHPGNRWNSSALGRYQIVQKTLRGLKAEMGLTDDMPFTKELQDRMAIQLLERRGLSKWQSGQMSDDQFMESLSKEWASLPSRTGSSYYGQRTGATRGGIMTAFNKMRGRDVASVNADEAFRSVLNSSSDLVTSNTRGYEPDLDGLHPEFRSQVSELQAAFGKALPIVSGFRDRTRNAKAGGAKDSQHTHRNAVDIDVSEWSREERVSFIRMARQMGFGGIGVYANSIHIDAGSKRAWGPSHHKDSIPAWAMEALNT